MLVAADSGHTRGSTLQTSAVFLNTPLIQKAPRTTFAASAETKKIDINTHINADVIPHRVTIYYNPPKTVAYINTSFLPCFALPL